MCTRKGGADFSSTVKQVKQTNTSEYVRTQRILHLEDSVKHKDKQIAFT